MGKYAALEEVAKVVRECTQCPFLVNYTAIEDYPQQVRYCALLVEFNEYGWRHHSPDYNACPLKAYRGGI